MARPDSWLCSTKGNRMTGRPMLFQAFLNQGNNMFPDLLAIPTLGESGDFGLGLASNAPAGVLGRLGDIQPPQTIERQIESGPQKISASANALFAQITRVECSPSSPTAASRRYRRTLLPARVEEQRMDQPRSTIMATPCPPPMQSEATPRSTSRSCHRVEQGHQNAGATAANRVTQTQSRPRSRSPWPRRS